MGLGITVALAEIKYAMEHDQGYADVWHDNIAGFVMDSSTKFLSYELACTIANEAASRIMKHCFGVETKNPSKRTPVPPALSWLNDVCGGSAGMTPKLMPELKPSPVHYVNNILDDNAFCGEYTWKSGMHCTMNILDVTCGCCAEKFTRQEGTVKWACGHYNRKNHVGDCSECQGVGLTYKQETPPRGGWF